MKEFKGTQGIWRFHDKRPYCDGFSIFAADQYIAFVGDSDSVTDCKTNAKLIAAAPELLEALQYARNILSQHVDSNHGVFTLLIKQSTKH